MTVEHRMRFAIGDVLSLTCECKKCDVRVSVHPDKVRVDQLRRCPVCAHDWLNDERVNDVAYTSPIARFLSAIPATLKNEEGLGFRLVLELPEPER